MKARYLLMILLVGMTLTASVSCKKKILEQYEDILKKLMTDGSWIITGFTENGVNITASFNGWVCKFHDDNTMTATQGSGSTAVTKSGTWQSDLNAQTITAQFSASVGEPLSKINGTWAITSSNATVGNFAQTKNGVNYTMELTKY